MFGFEGLLTGVVVDSGDGVTHICPVYEGFSLPHLTRRLDIAGRDITRYLIKVSLFLTENRSFLDWILILFGGKIMIKHQCSKSSLFHPQLLLLRGYAFNHSADFETVRMLKEKLCYVGYNIEQEQRLATETTYLMESYMVGWRTNTNTVIKPLCNNLRCYLFLWCSSPMAGR